MFLFLMMDYWAILIQKIDLIHLDKKKTMIIYSILHSFFSFLSFDNRMKRKQQKKRALRVGFEPTREDPIGFLVQRLNHSAIAAVLTCVRMK